MPRPENLAIGEPVWAHMDGYPWWPGRVVTLDEVVVDDTEEIPEVTPDSHLIEFFNDNKRFASIRKKFLRSFLNPRYNKINMNYSGSYLEDLNVAIRECRDYVENKGLKYKPGPKPKNSAATPSRKIAPKREPKSELSDIGSDEPEEEEQQRPRKRRQAESEERPQEKVKISKDAESSSRKRKKRKHADIEEEVPPKPDKKKRVVKNEEPLEVLPVPDKPRRGRPRKSEPSLERDDSTDKKGHDGSKKGKERRQEDRSNSMKAKPAKEGKRRDADEKTAKNEPVVDNRRLEVKGRDVTPKLTDFKSVDNKERDESEGCSRSGKNGTRERRTGADSKRERGRARADEERAKLGDGLDSLDVKQQSEAMDVDLAYAGLSRWQLLEIVNMLEKEVRSYRVELRELRMGMGITGDLVENPGDFVNLCAPGFGAVAKLITACEKNKELSSSALEEMEADAVEKLDALLRVNPSREALKEKLAKLARRAMKLGRRVLRHSVKVGRVMRELVVQWMDMAVIETMSSAGSDGEPHVAVKSQRQEEKVPENDGEKREVQDNLMLRGCTEEAAGEREPKELKEGNVDTNGTVKESKVDTNGAVKESKVDTNGAVKEKNGDANEAAMESKVDTNGAVKEGKVDTNRAVNEGNQDTNGAVKESNEDMNETAKGNNADTNRSVKNKEDMTKGVEVRDVHEAGTGKMDLEGGVGRDKEKAEEHIAVAEEGNTKGAAQTEGKRSLKDEVGSEAKKDGEVKDDSDEKHGDKTKKVCPSERHERRVREFTRERCLDTFKKVLHPLKGSEVKGVLVDDEKLEELAEALERAVEPTRKENMHRYFEKSRKVLKVLTGSSQSRNEVLKCVIAKNSIRAFVARCLNNEFVKDKENNGN